MGGAKAAPFLRSYRMPCPQEQNLQQIIATVSILMN